MINLQTSNNAQGPLKTTIGASAVALVLYTGYGELFPSVFPYELTIEQFDTLGRVTKREIVNCTGRTDDVFTIVRSYGYCPSSYSALTQTNTAFSFNPENGVVMVSLNITSNLVQTLIEEVNGKLAKSAGLRDGFGAYKVFTTDENGNETESNIADIVPDSSKVSTTEFIAGESLVSGNAVCLENMETTDVVNVDVVSSVTTHGAASAVGSNTYEGDKFTVTENCRLIQAIVQDPANTNPTLWRLLNGSTVIGSGALSGLTINTDIELLTTGTYYLEVTNNTTTWYNRSGGSKGVLGRLNIAGYSRNGAIQITAYSATFSSITTRVITGLNIGETVSSTRKSIAFIGSGTSGDSLSMQLLRVGVPQNLTVRIETDNAGNPSGVLASPNAIATILSSSVLTTPSVVTATFPASFSTIRGNIYHAVYCQGTYGSEVVDALNYYRISYSPIRTSQSSKAYNGSAWSAEIDKKTYLSGTLIEKYLLVKTNASLSYRYNFEGIAEGNFSRGQNAVISRLGMTKTISGLTPRTKYYLANTDGAISTTAGTNARAVGTSLTESILDIGMYPST